MHRLVMRGANLVSTPDSSVRRALSPAYTTLQYALTGGRGVAAEQLDLPFSTYRRHLTAGIQRLTQMLWQLEIGER